MWSDRGILLPCIGDMTTPVSPLPPLYIGAQEFLTGPYSTNVNQVVKVELDGQTYYANGSARFRTDPNAGGVPYPGFYLIAGTGTVHRLVEGGYEVLGSYTSNIALPLPDYPTTEDSGGIVVIRISESGYVVPPIGG